MCSGGVFLRKLLNALYVSSQGSYLHREGEMVVVEREKQKILQLPIHTLGGIVCFGNVLCLPFLLGFCVERDVSISFLSGHGRFLASVQGPVRGNVSTKIDRTIECISRGADDSEIRDFEGQAAAEYFRVFDHLELVTNFV
jgi:CRISPR/Cas system-associated endonuclease Cas1